jgi:diguanylate cyclase (GGDEF)-like protein
MQRPPDAAHAPSILGAREPDIPGIDPPSGWTDALCTTDGPIFWARLMTSEAARIRRYRRSATVVLFELAGLERLGRMWGFDVAIHSLVQAAAILTSQIRSSDQAARITTARFGIYLPETNEIDAINFVERTRAAVIADLGPSGELVTPAFGWASPTDGELEAAVLIAEERLAREIAAANTPKPPGPLPG